MNRVVELVFVIFVAEVFAQKDSHIHPDRNTIVHFFEWKWDDIANECEQFLKQKGYGGVQLSPVSENKIIKNRPWYERYQPVSYKLVTRSGNEQQLASMVKRCNAAGIRVYADVVINHMTGTDGETVGTGGSKADPGNKQFPAVPYTPADFHENCGINNYKDADEIRKCELSGLKDLDQSKPHVREQIVKYMNHLIDLGVAGFRIDAAKHMYPKDLAEIYKALKNLNTEFGFPANSRPYIYQEIIDLGGKEPVKREHYTPYGAVLEFRYGNNLSNILRGDDKLKVLKDWGPKMGLLPDSKDAVVFIENHDNERGHGAGGSNIIMFKDTKLFKMAHAFMLAHPYGSVTRILSDYNFDDRDAGPPHDANYNTLSPQPSGEKCQNGWMCEHRWHEISNMVAFRNSVKGTGINNFWSNPKNADQISFCRGKKGFIVFTNKGDVKATFKLPNCLPPGTYCDVITGEVKDGKCTGKSVKVGSGGTGRVEVSESVGVLAIHAGSKIA